MSTAMLSSRIFSDESENRTFIRQARHLRREYLWSVDIDDIFRLYRPNEAQILDIVRFLSRHSYLIPILQKALPYIREVFGETLLHLELDIDPESGFEELFVLISGRGTPEEALALESRFDKRWFLGIVRRTRNRLNFKVTMP